MTGRGVASRAALGSLAPTSSSSPRSPGRARGGSDTCGGRTTVDELCVDASPPPDDEG